MHRKRPKGRPAGRQKQAGPGSSSSSSFRAGRRQPWRPFSAARQLLPAASCRHGRGLAKERNLRQAWRPHPPSHKKNWSLLTAGVPRARRTVAAAANRRRLSSSSLLASVPRKLFFPSFQGLLSRSESKPIWGTCSECQQGRKYNIQKGLLTYFFGTQKWPEGQVSV